MSTYRPEPLCVFVHQDADGPDAAATTERDLHLNLQKADLTSAHAVVPIEEIESWWFLFPAATESYRESWQNVLKRNAHNWDAVSNPKEELKRLTGQRSVRKAYEEADSPRIAIRIADAIVSVSRQVGTSPSFDRFADAVSACCDKATED
ncbi:hypothetical protein [Candidatus Poriferisodalis sp.]|uniref:hypothetical protein n=1 Tax=Candidatus Poriferisodalis sp. TaxID=3101277 RepID=UPI003B01B197